jgi:DNA polymerase elongation subunit (family B)
MINLMGPKIVIFDLETLPNLKEALKVWPQLSSFPGKTLRAQVSTIICAGFKIYGKRKTECINAWDFKEWKKDVNNDYKVCEAIYNILKDADAVVTHNGKRFDWKFLQTRLLKNGFPPLAKTHHIDTKQIASSNAYFFNNRLGNIGEFLVDEKKLDHEGWELWVRVYNKERSAMNKMERYCKQDVKLLEKIFKKLLPFVNNMPNYNLYYDPSIGFNKNVCPNCQSTRLESKGYRHTKTQTYKRYICRDCGTYSRTDKKDRMPRTL